MRNVMRAQLQHWAEHIFKNIEWRASAKRDTGQTRLVVTRAMFSAYQGQMVVVLHDSPWEHMRDQMRDILKGTEIDFETRSADRTVLFNSGGKVICMAMDSTRTMDRLKPLHKNTYILIDDDSLKGHIKTI